MALDVFGSSESLHGFGLAETSIISRASRNLLPFAVGRSVAGGLAFLSFLSGRLPVWITPSFYQRGCVVSFFKIPAFPWNVSTGLWVLRLPRWMSVQTLTAGVRGQAGWGGWGGGREGRRGEGGRGGRCWWRGRGRGVWGGTSGGTQGGFSERNTVVILLVMVMVRGRMMSLLIDTWPSMVRVVIAEKAVLCWWMGASSETRG